MTLSTTTSRVTYPGAGGAGPFAFPFRILAPDDLVVTKRSAAGIEAVLTYIDEYSVTGVGHEVGNVTLQAALAVGDTLTIRRVMHLQQDASIRDLGPNSRATIEDQFDRLVMIDQQLEDAISRSMRLSETFDPSRHDMVLRELTAGKVVTGTGTGLTMSALSSGAVSLPGEKRTVSTLSEYLANNAVFNVLDYAGGIVINNGVNNATTAINLAIAAAGVAGGTVLFPAGVYKATSPIVVPRWVRLVGVNATGIAGGTTYDGISVILGAHTGVAILDFRGTQAAGVEDLKVYGDSRTTPKTGILLGRNSTASAGFHLFVNVSVEGYFSKAAVYSIASEENVWIRPHISLLGGGAKYCFYTSQGDDLGVGGLTGSSNIQGTLHAPWIRSDVNDATSALIYINAGGSTFAWTFSGGYLLPKSGAYVAIMTGQVDGADTPGQFVFIGVNGEKNPGGLEPVAGFDLLVSGAHALHGLQVLGCTFQLKADTGRMVRQAANLTLEGCDVRCRARGGIGSSLVADKIHNSRITDGYADIHQFYGDTGFYGKIFGSGDNTKGYFFGATGPRLRLQPGMSQIQATSNDGKTFYDLAANDILVGGTNPIKAGTGSPEGVVTAPIGSLFLRTDGGVSTTLYVKTSGSGKTGWTGK
jgi:hypothetical protein